MSGVRVLTYTGLFPNAVRPRHGIFVAKRTVRVAALPDVDLRVVAPVPFFPFRGRVFGEYGKHAAVPHCEHHEGLDVLHPRHFVIPKIGMQWAPSLLVRGTRRTLQAIHERWPIDVIDAHYLYPDGVAAVRLGAELGVPVVLTARGSDVNRIPHCGAFALDAVVDACRRACAVVTVSQALRESLVELGVERERIEVVYNGVDHGRFAPVASRRDGPPRLLSVGSLIPSKGHDLVIDALGELPDATLTIVGDGPTRSELEARARPFGERVSFVGSVDHQRLAQLYSDADALVLASEMEGLPNVVLEALASGTPVVATSVGGIPEAVTTPEAGVLLEQRNPPAIAHAVLELLANPRDRAAIRATVARFDWDTCARSSAAVLERAVSGPNR